MDPALNPDNLPLRQERVVFARMRGTQDRVADAITAFAGTMLFVYLHAFWFAVWIALNEGLLGRPGSSIRTPTGCSR